MSNAPKKKASKKAKRAKKSGNVKPIGKEYRFSNQESISYAMIQSKLELAAEKEKSAAEIRASAEIMRQQWVSGLLAQRSIPKDAKVNINIENRTVTVLPKCAK